MVGLWLSAAVCEKAQRLERLLLRLEAGEPFEPVRADLGLSVRAEDMPKLQAKYEAGGRAWEALIDGRYGHPQTAHSALREWMYERKREDESLTARELAEKIAEQFQVELSIGHINYLLRKVELTRPRGRPRRRREEEEEESAIQLHLQVPYPGALPGRTHPRAGRISPGRRAGLCLQPSLVSRGCPTVHLHRLACQASLDQTSGPLGPRHDVGTSDAGYQTVTHQWARRPPGGGMEPPGGYPPDPRVG